jgi:DNA primase
VEICSETGSDFLCFCPFHGNKFTPSFSVSKSKGKYICFNHSCGEHGSLIELIKKVGGMNEFQARRLIITKRNQQHVSFDELMKKALVKEADFLEFSPQKIEEMYRNFWENPKAVKYMTEERGFTEDTLRHFKIGFSAKKDIIAVPMHDVDGKPIGVIGRTVGGKAFKNSKRLPTSKTLWNIHRAKRAGSSVVIVEASFDGMKVHQAGHPCVVACLGGNFSPYHKEQLEKYFSEVINMTDFDNKEKHMYNNCKKCSRKGLNLCIGHNPGRDLGATIAKEMARKKVTWAMYDEGVVFPPGCKDADDMTDQQIRQTLANRISNFQYERLGVY